MKIKTVGFTGNVCKILKRYARSHEGSARNYAEELADVVIKIKRQKGLNVDTSDNAVTFAGVPLSFIRDWNRGRAYIMTNAEALALDNEKPVYTTTIRF